MARRVAGRSAAYAGRRHPRELYGYCGGTEIRRQLAENGPERSIRMTVVLWRIAAGTAKYVATDMTGTGEKKTSGLWNPVGLAANYSSESIALAMHETVLHLRSGELPLNRYSVHVDVQDDVWTARQTLTPPVSHEEFENLIDLSKSAAARSPFESN
jgi:RES domain-containing protein